MVQYQQILDQELFPFIAFHTGFVNLHWDCQTFFYLIYQAGGISLLEFVHACLMTLGFAFLFLITHRHLWKKNSCLCPGAAIYSKRYCTKWNEYRETGRICCSVGTVRQDDG
jgi:hypothetical protein